MINYSINVPQLEGGGGPFFSWRIGAQKLHYWDKELLCLIDTFQI